MAQLKFGSAGVTAREIDLTGPVETGPTGIPAGVIGTSVKGPAFVPLTYGTLKDFFAKFGESDSKKFGPLAVSEWLSRATSVTYLRVLGVGDGKQRIKAGATAGEVVSAGFVVGEEQPQTDGTIGQNPFANFGGPLGRTYFLSCFMSESVGSTFFSDAGLQGPNRVNMPSMFATASVPIVRGILMAPSGVILRLSSAVGSVAGASAAPASTLVADESNSKGTTVGSLVLSSNNASKQEFTLLLNGHKGNDASYPNVLTASFDVNAANFITKVFNTDPYKLQRAGHYLAAHWDIHPSLAVLTGTGVVPVGSGSTAPTTSLHKIGTERIVFLSTSSLARNVGSATVPNYESFRDRFSSAHTPWVISQKFGGKPANLFRFHSLDSGAGVSNKVKISISNITPSSAANYKYGSFNVSFRRLDDNDVEPKVLESFNGVNLDPSSDRYIAKVIGDVNAYYDFDRDDASQKLVIEGNYSLRSRYVRVEVSNEVIDLAVDPSALPMGFRGIAHLVTSGSAPLASLPAAGSVETGLVDPSFIKNAVEPPLPFRKNITDGSGVQAQENLRYHWGAKFEHVVDLNDQNSNITPDKSFDSFTSYFPDFSTVNANFVVGDNTGAADTAALGIVDADRFCNNLFTLEHVQIVTGSNGTVDQPDSWKYATYVRNGAIPTNDATKTRAVNVSDLTFSQNRKFLKFSMVMQGGFDGVNIFDEDESQINNAAVTADMGDVNRGREKGPNVSAYLKALEVMKNTTNVDIQLLAIPGIRTPVITDAAIAATEERFDALYIMDIEQVDKDGNLINITGNVKPSVGETILQHKARDLNTSFAAAYFPDVLMKDPSRASNTVVVPPSVVVLGALALNDSLGYPWFAPAGQTRGVLPTTLETSIQLKDEDLDSLYDEDINPLFAQITQARGGLNPKGGVVVWGQKTLYQAASALDRINVRRLLIDVRRQVREIAQTIIFEPNREATLARFSAAVTPRLQRIQALAGLERFRVIIDSSTTTQADVENNTVRGKIFLQPTKTIEFVSLDFVVANNLQSVS
jgi:phage tail sheath protein FI